jgi:hypothetical protein
MFRRLKVKLKWYKRTLTWKWKHFKCDTLGWHKPVTLIGFDGCSYVAVCTVCHKKLLQDSQGNWFEAAL